MASVRRMSRTKESDMASVRRLSRNLILPRLSRERLSTFDHQGVKLENSYRLEPTRKIKICDVERAVKSVMEDYLDEKIYAAHSAAQWTKELSHIVKSEVKLLGYSRYKIAVLVTIGSKTEPKPTIVFTSQAVWQPDFDQYVDVVYENKTLYALAVVYAVYSE